MPALERYEPLIDDFEAFTAACARPLPTAVRVNTIKCSIERATHALGDVGVEWTPCTWDEHALRLESETAGNTWPYVHGWLHGQEEISQLPATVLDPQPGERVWDATAAPGGKATQLSALMDDVGFVVANDDNLGRLSALRFNAQRLGVTNLVVTRADARNYSMNPFEFDRFDRTLVDAPCTCEGTVRKNPAVLEEWSPAHVEGVAGVQKGILRRAVQATAHGGTVVYATCTFAPEENEAVLDHVLEREACTVVPFEVELTHDPGVTAWEGETYDEQVRFAKRFYPHQNDTGGFFCAKLEVGA